MNSYFFWVDHFHSILFLVLQLFLIGSLLLVLPVLAFCLVLKESVHSRFPYRYYSSYYLHTPCGLHPIIHPAAPRWDSLAVSFYRTRELAKCPIPITLGDLGLSVTVYSFSCKVPILASGTRFSPLHDSRDLHVAQGSWRGHACIGHGRNTWIFQVLLVSYLQLVRHPWDHLLPLGPLMSASFLNNTSFPVRLFGHCIWCLYDRATPIQ